MRAYRSAIFVIPRVGAPARLLTTRRYNDSSPAWSPDHRRIAFVRSLSPESGYQIWIMNADGRNARQLTRGRVDGAPDWSPDGRWIAYRSGGDIYLLSPDGSRRRNVTRNPAGIGATNPSWSADGRRIAFQRSAKPVGTGVYSIGIDGRGLKRLARDGYDPDWSPDGRGIVYVQRVPFSDAGWQLHTMGPNGGAKRRITRDGGNESPHFSPDGTWIAAVRNEQVTVMRADGIGVKQLTKRRAGFTIDALAW
ncbi:MAG TPA: hypothetical protein VMN35_07645 [Gaiellaceae bacterium]|nr:hypothetical protein [Gaiellaceae bacterium]